MSRDGLIPNMFPEGEKEGLYHTADATLWFFHALERYLRCTGDQETLRESASDAARYRRRGTCAARVSVSMSIRPTVCWRRAQTGIN